MVQGLRTTRGPRVTVEELSTEVARRRALGLEGIVLVIPGQRNGLRARVFPGVMGDVCSVTDDSTVVYVLLADVERALAKRGPL